MRQRRGFLATVFRCAVATTQWLPGCVFAAAARCGMVAHQRPRRACRAPWFSSARSRPPPPQNRRKTGVARCPRDRGEPAGLHGFRLLGRADRIVKIEEKRVSLDAMEQQLLKTPWVQEAKALVVDTPIGARVGVVAVLTPAGREQVQRGQRILLDLLRTTLASGVQAVALPRRWRFVDALPVNAQGKSPEALLRALFTAQSCAGMAAPDRPEMPAVQWLERSKTEALATLDIHSDLK